MADDLMQGAKATLATDAPSFVHEPWRTAHDGQAGRAKPMGLCCAGQSVTRSLGGRSFSTSAAVTIGGAKLPGLW